MPMTTGMARSMKTCPMTIHHDFTAGIMLIDDDGDGSVDEGSDNHSDDEVQHGE